MELRISYSFPSCLATLNHQRNATALTRKHLKRGKQCLSVLPSFVMVSAKFDETQLNQRRSANYHPSIWDQKLIESFTTPYSVSPFTINTFPHLLWHIYALLVYIYYNEYLVVLCCSMRSMPLGMRDWSKTLKLCWHPQKTEVSYWGL